MVAPQRGRTRRSIAFLAILSAGPVLAADAPRGTFAFGKAALIEFVRISDEKLTLGVLVHAKAQPFKNLLNCPVIELPTAAARPLRGRCDARLFAPGAKESWLTIERWALTEKGSLRLDIAFPAGGTLSLTLARSRPVRVGTPLEPGAEPAKPPADQLAGIWLAPSGDITRYVSDGGAVRGYVVRVAPAKNAFGFKPGEESVRVRRIGPGLYAGTVKARTADGRSWWEPVQFAVQGDELTYTRHCRSGEVEKGAARRL